jgi:DNA polymerase III delta subunit
MERGETATAIAKETGLPDWLARSAIEQARRFEPAELVRALREAAGVEAALKSGSGDERVTYESWLIGVCRRS